MSEDVIHFSCGSCQTKLTVPSNLAGVEGPCPKCGARIQAPQSAPTPAVTAPAPEPEPAPTPPEAAAAESAAESATCRRPDALPERRSPVAATSEAEQERIRPQPRELPERPARPSVSPRHSTDDVSRRPSPRAERASGAPKSTSGLRRFVIPIVFLFIGGALAYVLLHSFLGNQNPPPISDNNPPPENTNPPTPPGDATNTATGGNEGNPNAATPLPAESSDPVDGQLAEDALRNFLRASSLGARLSFIEPAYEREELAGSVIDTPLLSVDRILPDAPSRNKTENFVDHPFRVRFEQADGEPFSTLIIVRKRSEQKPKVLIDPLLDLFGGRLEAFASAPTGESQTFRAVIEAMPRCFEEGVPNPDDKITYKLSSSTHGGEIARAYASKLSPLAEMLYSPDSALRWGKRLPATVTLRWNMGETQKAPAEATTEEEDPTEEAPAPEEETVPEDAPPEEAPPVKESSALPYLELIEIKSLDWSP